MTDPRNVSDLVSRAAARHPAKPALVAGSRTVTWGELEGAVAALAAGLLARGLAAGDRVGLLLPNGIEFATAYFGVLRAGLVALPLNTAYTAAEIGYQLADSGASLVLASDALAGLAAGSPAEVVAVGSDAWSALVGASGAGATVESAAARGGAEDTAVLLYTSGTSGRPKGAMLTHRALLANLAQLARIEPAVVAPDDRVLLVLPLFHVYGLNAGLGMTAYVGATGVLAERFDPVETLGLVEAEQVSNIVGAPPMYVAWSMLPRVSESLVSLRLAVSGSAPLPPPVVSSLLDTSGHHVFEGYGLTETAPVVTTSLCSEVPKPGSIGRPIPGVELLLLDDRGEEVDEGDPGEIVVRGANLFSGYWPDGRGGPDADGWFRTGDVAVADDDGDLFLVDRVRELILVSGFNVYPREVEDAIEGHPAVAEVAVIGIPHPYTGETVKAFVVPVADATPTADDIIEYAARRLARFKCPTSVEIVPELPHSAIGKVAKGRLRESA
ncbi:MAG: long-chain acyl-CoA synthetase [Frankiaceae bacterium]|jgi:long-chain acyl-CoA synthetase|nr:long-chain acyl-CoA synthetase [Frankiaceae bacterium]